MAGLLGAIGSIFSGFGAASAAKKQLALQTEEYHTQKALATRQQMLAEQLANQGVATRTDGAGNITYYDHASNSWRTMLSPQQQAMQQQSDKEQLNRVGVDATAARNQRIAATDVRGREGQTAAGLAGQLQDQLTGRGAVDANKTASELALSRRGAISQGLNDYQTELGSQALRSGASGLDRVGSAMAIARARAVAEGMGNPQLEGDQYARSTNEAKTSQLGGLYNGFASRASNIDNASFSPAGLVGDLRGTQSEAASNATQALSGSALADANAARVLGTAPKPNYQLGNTLGPLISGIGSTLGGNSGGGGDGGLGGFLSSLFHKGSGGGGGGGYNGADAMGQLDGISSLIAGI